MLVQRALRLIAGDAPVDADRLLILTFSNAAAAELRSRLALALEQRIAQRPADTRLRGQQLRLQRASISTVSAFCMQLLRENFSALDIPPDFQVADEAQLYELRQATLAEVLEESYRDPDFAAFASIFGRSRTDREAGGALLAVYDHLRALPFFGRALEEINALYRRSGPLASHPWGVQLIAGAREAAQGAAASARAALALIDRSRRSSAGGPPSRRTPRGSHRPTRCSPPGTGTGRGRTSRPGSPPACPACGGGQPGEAAVQSLRAELKEARADLLENRLLCTEAEFWQDAAAAAPLVAALCRAVALFDERFFAAKCAEKVLEFSDFEHLALRLLAGEDGAPTALAGAMRARFDAVMVDEYQDTNAIQDQLYRLLAREDGSNLFLVGDVKQSIYRFRKAMPEIFIEKKDRFAPYDGHRYPASLILEHNFRSSTGVIRGINYLFSRLMSRAVGELDYAGGELLVPGSAAQEAGLPPPELLVVDVSDSPLFGEADAVAEEICRMWSGATPCGTAGEGCGGAATGTSASCCAPPARRPSSLPTPSPPAARRSTPISGRGCSPCRRSSRCSRRCGCWTTPRTIRISIALASPMFDFSSGELAALREKVPQGSLWAALRAGESEKAKNTCRRLDALRDEAAFLPVDGLCRLVLEKTGYLLAVQAEPGGEDAAAARRSALAEFVRMAADYAASGSGGLSGFLRRVDSALAAGIRPAAGGAKPPEGYVKIMSIHRSKGLEFPVCILADTARQFNRRELYTAPVLRHTRLGVGLCLRSESGARYPTGPQRAIRQALEQEQLSEEMRVLYVALTRAKDRLLLTVAAKEPARMLEKLSLTLLGAGGLTPAVVAGAASFGQWLCMAALLHPAADALRQAAGAALLPLAQAEEDSLTVRLCTAPAHTETLPQEAAPAHTAPPDEGLLAALRESFGWRYPRAALLGVPAKVSVTALVRAETDAPPAPPKRPSFLYASGLSAAERGTALHEVLQYADFAAARSDLEGELQRLVERQFITPVTAAAADRRALRAFLEGPLMDRMLAADRLLREYAFFTRIPAGSAAPLEGPLAAEPVLVQGVADCVIEKDGELYLVDYKTDRGKSPDELRRRYAPQLALYRQALSRRLGMPVVGASLYAFALDREIEVL